MQSSSIWGPGWGVTPVQRFNIEIYLLNRSDPDPAGLYTGDDSE